MSNYLMIIGLLGMVGGVLAPIFQVLNKKPRRSIRSVIVVMGSLVLFVIGIIMGLE